MSRLRQQNIAGTWRSFVSCLYASASGTVLENLTIIKLRRLKSTRAGACKIQILQELKLEPALLRIKRTGRVSNWIINTVTGFLPGIFFRGGGQNLLLCKFLFLCYCFRTKFQGGAKVFREANCLRGPPCPPPPPPPVEESQVIVQRYR